MRRTRWLLPSAAAVALTAASVTALAATTGGSGPTPVGGRWSSGSCAPARLPGTTVTVRLWDMGNGMGMMGGRNRPMGRMGLVVAPASVPAGRVSLLAVNRGALTHELVVLPLAKGARVGQRPAGGDRTVSEAGSLGEASRGCGVGAGEGIAPGEAGWVTLTLGPGRYELVCNRPGHYAAGMFGELDVT